MNVGRTCRLLCLVMAVCLWGCSAPKTLSPPPSLFGVALDMPPHEADRILREQLFRVQDWRSEPPALSRIYQNTRADDPFTDIELQLCMQPPGLLRIRLRGEPAEQVYKASLGKFAARKGDPDFEAVRGAPSPVPGQTHSRRFAGQTTLRIETFGDTARLTLENNALEEACNRQLAKDTQLMRDVEQQRSNAQEADLQKVL